MQFLDKVAEHFKTQFYQYVPQIYDIVSSVISLDCIKFGTGLDNENSQEFDPNVKIMQTQLLVSFSQLIDKYPQ